MHTNYWLVQAGWHAACYLLTVPECLINYCNLDLNACKYKLEYCNSPSGGIASRPPASEMHYSVSPSQQVLDLPVVTVRS